MPRGPRYIPPGWSVEITTSTICNFYLLPVTREFARVFVGVLGRAQEKYPVRVHAAVAISSHYHLIVTPDDAEQLANFMEHLNGNLAREVGRMVGWRGRFWRERYHAIPISPEPEALESRMRYVLSHAVKEQLVAKVSEWEGLHCAEALIDGKPLAGMWYDRALEYETRRQAERRAERRGSAVEEIERGAFMTPYELKLAPLPCWRTLSPAAIRKKVAEMIGEIEAEAAARCQRIGVEPRGMEKIRNQDPLTRPENSKRSPKPLCHAASKEMRERVALRPSASCWRPQADLAHAARLAAELTLILRCGIRGRGVPGRGGGGANSLGSENTRWVSTSKEAQQWGSPGWSVRERDPPRVHSLGEPPLTAKAEVDGTLILPISRQV